MLGHQRRLNTDKCGTFVSALPCKLWSSNHDTVRTKEDKPISWWPQKAKVLQLHKNTPMKWWNMLVSGEALTPWKCFHGGPLSVTDLEKRCISWRFRCIVTTSSIFSSTISPPTHCWHNWWWKLRWWSAMAPQSPSQLNKCWQLWTKGAQRRQHSWCHTIPRFYYELRGFIWKAKFILPFQTLNILESICTRFFLFIVLIVLIVHLFVAVLTGTFLSTFNQI